MRRAGVAAALLVLAGTVLVAAGIGQGSPPHALPITGAAIRREDAAMRSATPTALVGEKLFDSHGCSDCHTIGAGGYTGRLGPRLDVQSQGDNVRAIEAKITDPPDDDTGYEAGLMPENFGQRLSTHDIHALAVYIRTVSTAAGRTPKRHRHRHRRR